MNKEREHYVRDDEDSALSEHVHTQDGIKAQKRKTPAKKLLLALAVVGLVAVCAACTPRQATEDTSSGAASGETEASPAVQITWSPTTDCATCHTTEAASQDAILCTASDGGEESPCLVCHIDEAGLSTVHSEVTTEDRVPTRLKKTEVADETCLSCHYETREALIAATADIAPVTDDNGLAINPHNPGTEGHDAVSCATCHNSHESSDIPTLANDTCRSCHHQGVFECYTCHP